MEARVAAFLDKCKWPWEYEPRAFASVDGQYLPDFRLPGRATLAYLEVKGVIEIDDYEPLYARMSIIRASEPEARLLFCDDRMLRHGYFMMNLPGLGLMWTPVLAMRCPSHPSTVTPRTTARRGDGLEVSPWCSACDPNQEAREDLPAVSEYRVTEASA